jgi:Trk K+ transport system NAD-binding subunit
MKLQIITKIAENIYLWWTAPIFNWIEILLIVILLCGVVIYLLLRMNRGKTKPAKRSILKDNHLVILGLNSTSLAIIDQLVGAGKLSQGSTLLILAEKGKELTADISSGKLWAKRKVEIVVETGAVSDQLALKRLSLERAKTVIIVDQVEPENRHKNDLRVLRAILTIQSLTTKENFPHIVAKLYSSQNRKLAEDIFPGRIWTVDEDRLLTKLLAKSVQENRLFSAYSKLLALAVPQLYFSPVPLKLCHLSFGEINSYLPHSIPLGIRDIDNQTALNPQPTQKLRQGDELLLLAMNSSARKYHSHPFMTSKTPQLPPLQEKKLRKKILIIGWNNRTTSLIREYNKLAGSGSLVNVAVKTITKNLDKVVTRLTNNLTNLKIKLLPINPIPGRFVRELAPEKYDTLILSATPGGAMATTDNETLFNLLKIRSYFKIKEKQAETAIQTQLIIELTNSANKALVQRLNPHYTVITDQVVSQIMAQTALDHETWEIYDKLLKENGELSLKPANLYLGNLPSTTTFTDLIFAAQSRNEIALGICYGLKNDEPPRSANVRLLPDKKGLFLLEEGDQLIVLTVTEN